MKKKILYVTKFIPAPAYGGGLKRNVAWLKFLTKYYDIDIVGFWSKQYGASKIDELSNLNLNIIGFDFHDTKTNSLISMGKSIFNKQPITNNRYFSLEMKKSIEYLCTTNDYEFVFFSEVATVQYRKYINNIPYLFDDHNVEFELISRTSEYSKFPVDFALKRDAKLMKLTETSALEGSHQNFFVSERDCKCFSKSIQKKSTVINNTYEDKMNNKASLSVNPTITFVGSVGWKPNRQGLEYFINNIYSQVKLRVDNIEFNLIGSNMSDDIKKMCEEYDIKIFENAEEQLKDDILDSTWLTVSPVYFGSGTRIKILEYWSHGKVVVSTKIGAEGLIKSKGTFVLDDNNKTINLIVDLLKDKKNINDLGKSNYTTFKSHYDERVVFDESLINIIKSKF